MAERLVLCGGLKTKRADRSRVIELDTQAKKGTAAKVNLQIWDISSRMVQDVPDVLADLLEIASYVYCADQFTKRGNDLMRNMGADWRRSFLFRIPVRRPDLWTSAPVLEALTDTLGFLSEDDYTFDFVRHPDPPPLQPYLDFGEPSYSSGFRPDEVVLFSGGLDSFAGAVEELIGNGKNVALVSHRSSTMVASKQAALIEALRRRTRGGQLFHVPVVVNKNARQGCEFTQRSRSFLFASLGIVVAALFRRKVVRFFENGIVSLNFPTADHVLGARATRTTHPRVLQGFSRLFSTLLDDDIKVDNPFFWKTKSEVTSVIAERGHTDLIRETFSCTRVRQATRNGKHCGVCSQCIDRRFGILGAGLGEHEPADAYEVDLFRDERKPGPDLTMAETYVLAAGKVAKMTEIGFLSTYGQAYRVLNHLPGSREENAKRIYELCKRHADTVCKVVDAGISNHAPLLRAQQLPSTCLLSLVVSPIAKQPAYADPLERQPKASEQAEIEVSEISRQPLVFAIDEEHRCVRFWDGIAANGADYEFLKVLADQFRHDLENGSDCNDVTYLKKERLMRELDLEEHSFRQRVRRCRVSLEKQFREKLGQPLGESDIIENRRWRGYRLNPSLLLVDPRRLRSGED
jgi:hypothetical protein